MEHIRYNSFTIDYTFCKCDKKELSKSTNLESSDASTSWNGDIFYRVKGKEKKGLVHCLENFVTSRDCGPSFVLLTFEIQAKQEKTMELEETLLGCIRAYKNRFLDENDFDFINEASIYF